MARTVAVVPLFVSESAGWAPVKLRLSMVLCEDKSRLNFWVNTMPVSISL
jgi:hypothetical protein